MNRDFFSFYTTFLEKYKKLLPILLVLIMIFSIIGVFQITIDTDFTVFMPQDSQYMKNLKEMRGIFGDTEQILYLVELDGGIDSTEKVKNLLSLSEELKSLDGIEHVQGPVPEQYMSSRKTFKTADLTEDNLEQFLSFMDNFRQLGGLATHEGHFYGTFQILMSGEVANRKLVREINTLFEERGYSYVCSGEPYLETKIFDYILKIILTLPPAAIILMLTVFRWRIRSLKATFLSLFPAVAGAAITLGAIGWFIKSISMVTVIVPVFIIVMGSADGLHFTSHFMDSLESGFDRRFAIEETLRAVGVPMVMTTLTTMVGFLSMMLINSLAIKTMGVIASAGIFLAGLVTWVFLPVVLIQIPDIKRSKKAGSDHIYLGISNLRGRKVYMFTTLLLIAFLPGLSFLRANFNMLSLFKPGTEVQRNINRINEVFGGSLPLSVLYSTEEDLFDPATANSVMKLEDEIVTNGAAAKSISLYRILLQVQTMMGGEKQAQYPQSSVVARLMATVINKQNPEMIKNFVNVDENTGRIMFFLRDLDNGTLTQFEKIISKYDDHLNLRIAGIPFVMKEMNEQIIPQQVRSLIFALVLVFLMISLTQRSFRLGAFSTLPILITLGVVFAAMGYAHIDLSVITGIMSGLTIGVGIDYAIHFSFLYRYFRIKGKDNPVEEALKYVSSPILANAMGLAIGFSVMMLSPLKIHLYLSILMWVSMVFSALLSLTLLPTLLSRKN